MGGYYLQRRDIFLAAFVRAGGGREMVLVVVVVGMVVERWR